MIRIQNRPRIDAEGALAAVREHYGLDGTLVPLPGERDRNFLLDAPDGARYVVKVSSPEEPQAILEFETEMIARVSRETHGLVRSSAGGLLVEHTDDKDTTHRFRVVDYLPGTLLAHVNPRSADLLEDLGRRLAELDSALGALPDHPPARVDAPTIRELHQRMFDQAWAWAGRCRTSDKNIGVYWATIPEVVRNFIGDARYWFERHVYPIDEAALRLHHRLVGIVAAIRGL